jgi:hypothetical protein
VLFVNPVIDLCFQHDLVVAVAMPAAPCDVSASLMPLIDQSAPIRRYAGDPGGGLAYNLQGVLEVRYSLPMRITTRCVLPRPFPMRS